jgi:hypothetical protein
VKFKLVSTRNVQRFFDATAALEERLQEREVTGLGLVYGKPGLGKTMAMDTYHAGQCKTMRVRTAKVRAMSHWSGASMLKSLLGSLGHEPRGYRKDIMFDQLAETLLDQPAVFLIDEIDSIAGSRSMLAILKDIHDVTGSAILMIGEERVDGLLKRFESFYNRVNRGALQHLSNHSEADVRLVVDQRCDFPVDPEVSAAIYSETGGSSMRSVVDRIRDMEAHARSNGLEQIEMGTYLKVKKDTLRFAPRLEAVNA